MQIISLSNHVVRKALQLSLSEMAVLCDVKQMSQSEKYSYWCIKSKDKMAEWLDLSRATVFNALNSLEAKGYIERSPIGVRPTKFIFDLDCAQEEIGIYIKNNEFELISAKIKESLNCESNNCTGSLKIRRSVQKIDDDSLKIRRSQSKNYTQDNTENKREKEIDISLVGSNEATAKAQEKVKVPKATKTPKQQKYSEDFEAFWKLYDKADAGGKKQCYEKWVKLPIEEKGLIMMQVKDYKQKQPDPKYRKNPITYFNQKPWVDFVPKSELTIQPKKHERIDTRLLFGEPA